MHTTPVTLLERLRETADADAWAHFVRLYTPLLLSWGRRCGLSPEDAADLTQDVFTVLVRKLPEFAYDPGKSFRRWLKTVTLNQWRDRRRRLRSGPPAPLPAEELPAPEAMTSFDDVEYRQELVGRALQLIRGDFQEVTWQAFWAHGVEGRPAAKVGAELGLSVGAVYGAKCRVMARLREEVEGLLE